MMATWCKWQFATLNNIYKIELYNFVPYMILKGENFFYLFTDLAQWFVLHFAFTEELKNTMISGHSLSDIKPSIAKTP